RAGVVVTSGGLYTVYRSLLFGVSLVVVPAHLGLDRVGERIESLGVGVWVRRQGYSRRALVDAVERVISEPHFRARSASYAEAIARASSPSRALYVIDELLKERCC